MTDHEFEWTSAQGQISAEDKAWWKNVGELEPDLDVTGQLYEWIAPTGMRTAVIGPYFLPHDASALQLAYSVGEKGVVYSIDPQGDELNPRGLTELPVGTGNSELYARQMEALRRAGFPLAPFVPLGRESSITRIPGPARELDLIADHASLEFINGRKTMGRARLSVESIVDALRAGGLWIHHAGNKQFLDICHERSDADERFDDWAARLNIRVMMFEVKEDSYYFPATREMLTKLGKETIFDQVDFGDRPARKKYTLTDDMLGFGEWGIAHPQHVIFVAQKLAPRLE